MPFPGANSKCTPQLTKKFAKYIRDGNFPNTACTLCGIAYQSYRNWMAAGERGDSPVHVAFKEAVEKAEAEGEAAAVAEYKGKVKNSPDYRAALSQLEKRYKNNWKAETTTRVEISGSVSHDMSIVTADLGLLSLEDKKLYASLIEKMTPALPGDVIDVEGEEIE